MSSKTDIWMPLYIGDYLADTSHLGALESGAYLHLLMHSWRTGELPADIETLRRIAKVDKDAWGSAWGMLQVFFKQCSNGAWIQPRLERERVSWNARKAAASEKASKAANARHFKDATSSASSNRQAVLEECPSPSSLTTSKDLKTTTPAKAAFVLPDWVDVEAWEGFVAMRRTIRKPLTDRGMSLAVAELQRLEARGHPHSAVLNQSTMSNWQGLFEIKGGNNGVTQGNSAIDRERRGLGAVKTADSAIRAGYVPFGRGQSHVPQPGASRDDSGSMGGDVDGTGSGVRTTLLP